MIKKKVNILTRPFNFLASWRSLPPYEMISYIMMYASVPMLAYGIQKYNYEIIRLIVFTVICLYSGFFAALIWNDITDSDIDSVSHPNRPIPSGRISKNKFFAIALVFSALTFIFSVLISITCFILVGISALFVTFHDKYLKKKIKFPAYSEIFTPIQWVVVAIFGFLAIWTALPQYNMIEINLSYLGNISTNYNSIYNMLLLVLFTYFTVNAHDLPEGIVDSDGDKKLGVKTYATTFGDFTAAKISFIWFIISGILGISLFIKTILYFYFLIPFLCFWIYIMFYSYKLLRSDKNNIKKNAVIVGRKGYDYFLFSYNLIFIDIFIQLILHTYT